jgi:hypothetical protein
LPPGGTEDRQETLIVGGPVGHLLDRPDLTRPTPPDERPACIPCTQPATVSPQAVRADRTVPGPDRPGRDTSRSAR